MGGCGGDGPFHRDVAAAPRQKKTQLSHARSRLCEGNGVRARAQTTRQRVAIGATVQCTACAWPRSMYGCAYWMPHWRDLTSDLYRPQLFISFDFRDFGQAQHKPRLRAILV